MKLDSIRREYRLTVLSEENIEPNPFKQFEKWMKEAIEAAVAEPTAMILSTFSADGFPDSRVVLLKNFNESGYTFFTNYNSQKGKSILRNTSVGLLFFWPELERQVRISGFAEKTDPSTSDEYFFSRPPNSRIAAVISNQSEKIESRKHLEQIFDAAKSDTTISRPDYWGGFLVKPVRFEFWQGRESRLHDRILYEKVTESWQISRLAP